MNGEDIIQKIKKLKFPKGSYIAFGSCPLALAGIRESQDIDMLVSNELFIKLQKDGWELANKGPKDNPLTLDDFEAHHNWNFSQYSPSLEHLLATATIVNGVPFASLDEVRKWKTASARPKDLKDIELIDKYFQ